mmetsp:Transcript_2850/g.3776  ORF Transcript_2850/g.3776 Transcript_2850/m.3776 type:complete len:212 (+) Transcript_2850:779-1414(+)
MINSPQRSHTHCHTKWRAILSAIINHMRISMTISTMSLLFVIFIIIIIILIVVVGSFEVININFLFPPILSPPSLFFPPTFFFSSIIFIHEILSTCDHPQATFFISKLMGIISNFLSCTHHFSRTFSTRCVIQMPRMPRMSSVSMSRMLRVRILHKSKSCRRRKTSLLQSCLALHSRRDGEMRLMSHLKRWMVWGVRVGLSWKIGSHHVGR